MGLNESHWKILGGWASTPSKNSSGMGRHVEIRRRLTFTGFQKSVIVIVTICAILGGVGGFVTGFNNASVFLCARHMTYLSCPPK